MTSPIVVGEVSVEVRASAQGFAKSLREAVIREFKGAGLDKAISDALGKTKVKVPIQPEFDPKSLPKTLPTPRQQAPRTQPNTDTDAVLKAFRADIQRQLQALAKQAITIPVRPDTDDLRAGISEQIGSIQRQLKAEVPVEPTARREFEQGLRAMVDEVSRHVPPAKVRVQADPLTKAFQQDIQKQLTSLSNTANVKIPVTADTAGLRERIAAQIAEVQRALKAEIPTEPGSRAAYEARLRAMLAEATARVKVSIPVDVDRNRFQQAVASLAASLPAGLAGAFERVGDAANNAGKVGAAALTSLASAVATAVNPVKLIAGILLGVVAAAVALGPAAGAAAAGLALLGGAIGSLPALAAGGGAVFATFGLALRGIADRFKATSKAAGGAGTSIEAQARQVAAAQRAIEAANRGLAAAERGLADAQRESQRAQEDLTRARKAAADRIEDLGRALRGAALDEEDAQLRIVEAQEALQKAKITGTPTEVKRAQLDLEQAQLAAENAADAASDLADQKADADKRGVEGSDEVTTALDRQRAAQEQVLSAQDALKSAQDSLTAANEQLAAANEKVGSSAASAAAKMIPLSPAAQRFVDTIKGLKPAFESLRLSVQDRFFDGLDGTVKRASAAWLSTLRTTLGQFADTFNNFFKNLGASASQPEFISNIAVALDAVRTAGAKVGQAVAGPLVDAFGRLARASKPFLEAVGTEIAGVVTDFSNWIKSADKSGKLNDFFATAAGYLHDIFQVGRSVASIIGSLFQILFGASAEGGGTGMVEAFQKLADFLKDPENQEKIRDYIARFVELGRIFVTDVLPALTKLAFAIGVASSSVKGFADTVGGAFTAVKDAIVGAVTYANDKLNAFKSAVGAVFQSVAASVGDGINKAKTSIGSLVSYAAGIPGRISSAVGNLGRLLYDAGRAVISGLINGIASMISPLGSYLGQIGQFIRDHKGPLDADRKLLVPAGQAIMQGLISGIASQRDALGTQLAAITSDVAGVGTDISAAYSASLGGLGDPVFDVGTPAVSPQPPIELRFGGDAPDSFMSWIRDNVRIYHGGVVQAAFGKA